MIISGQKSTVVLKETLMDKCPHCGTQHSVSMTIYRKYAHVFWVPFFPMGKDVETECAHCKQVLIKKLFPEHFKKQYELLSAQAKTPMWTWSGLVLLAVLIVWGFVINKQKNDKLEQWVQNPQKGDIIELRKENGYYSLLKIKSLINDSVYVLINKLETNKISGIKDIINQGEFAYDSIKMGMEKSRLKTLFDKGEIYDIIR